MTPLVSLAALEVACDDGVVNHVRRLSAAIAATSGPDRFVMERVREALQVHLALLQDRPDALWPALYAHCAFVDSPRARAFGVSAPGPDMPMTELVGRWTFEHRALHPEQPWLRALTPTTPWGGALVAELRRLPSPKLVSMTEAEVEIESNGQHFTWRFETGEQGNVRNPPGAPLPKGFAMPPGGGLVFERDGALQTLVQPGWTVDDVSFRGAHLTCLGSDLDETFMFVFDARTGAQVAVAEVRSFVAPRLSPGGESVVWHDRTGALCTRHLATGVTRAVYAEPATSLAVSPSGELLAAVEDGVVRVHRPGPAPALERAFIGDALPPAFSPDGGALLLGQYVLDGHDASLKQRHGHRARSYLEGGPAPDGLSLGRERLCVADGPTTESLDLQTGHVSRVQTFTTMTNRVAWSGNGRVFAHCRHQGTTVTLTAMQQPHRDTTVEASGPIEAIALDEPGVRLAVLLTDGTVELEARGTRLRKFPGATTIAFLARDRAIGVGGRTGTVVIGLDGSERWQSHEPFLPLHQARARAEWLSGLRPASVAESLWRSHRDGLLVVTHGGRAAVFPSTSADWLPSPGGATLVRRTTLLSYEAAAGEG